MMKPEDKSAKETKSNSDKKPYESPKLLMFGAVRDLTASGSSHANENSPGQSDKRP
jgi:hypothetical protein